MTSGRFRTRPVCLWATPRSVSTAFEKALSRIPSTAVVHEPFTDCYYFGARRRSDRYGAIPSKAHFDTSDALALIAAPTAAQVCVKDLAFQAEPYLTDAVLESVTSTFIVRHPRSVMRSLLKLKPDFTEDEYGFTALARLLDRVTAVTGRAPALVDGDEFRADPRAVLSRYCTATGLPFHDRMLSWNDGRIRRWSAGEELSQAKWHATLESSHGVLPPAAEDDAFVIPAHRQGCYENALALYDGFRGSRLPVATATE